MYITWPLRKCGLEVGGKTSAVLFLFSFQKYVKWGIICWSVKAFMESVHKILKFVRSPIDFEQNWRLFTLFPFSKHSKSKLPFKTFEWELDRTIVSSVLQLLNKCKSAGWCDKPTCLFLRRTVKDLIGNIQICYRRKFLYSEFFLCTLLQERVHSWLRTVFLRASLRRWQNRFEKAKKKDVICLIHLPTDCSNQ